MIGMAPSQRKSRAKASTTKSKDLSPTKVLAIVANWNNTSPAKASPKRKRARDEKLSASVPRSRRGKASEQRKYLSASSDDDETPSFKAKPFYSAAKRTRYLSPYERKEQLERFIDAGVDPKTLNRSLDELKRDQSGVPVGTNVKKEESRSASAIKSKPKTASVNASGRKGTRTILSSSSSSSSSHLPKEAAERKTTAPPNASKVNGNTPGAIQAALGQTCGNVGGNGEIRVTLSQRSPSEVTRSPGKATRSPTKVTRSPTKVGRSPRDQQEHRVSPRKKAAIAAAAEGPSPAPDNQWRRTSPRKSMMKKSASKGIQMYVNNLKKSGQKKGGKKTEKNQKSKNPPKGKTNTASNQKTKPQASVKPSPSRRAKTPTSNNVTTDTSNASSARGLDFGKSMVNGQDVAVLEKSFEEEPAQDVSNGSGSGSDVANQLMDFLIFHDDDFQEEDDVGRETENFVQNLLLEIDEDLEAADEALAKRSPRKRKMKTEKESMSASPASSKGTPNRRRISSTPRSTKKSTQPRLDDWLTDLDPKTTSSPANKKKSTVQRSGVATEGTVTMTPESSDTCTSSPKVVPAASTPDKPVKLYPVFTPPTSPHLRTNGTPTSRKKQGMMGKVGTPKGNKRSPLVKTLKGKNDNLEQTTLDLGQKRFGAVTCKVCGTVYTAAHPGDEADHWRFHKKYLSSIKFPGWKQEDVLDEYHDGRVIVVTHDAPRYAEKKVEEIKELVDRELGFLEANPSASKDLCKTYIFVTVDKKVGGCLIAEQITQGYRVIVEKKTTEDGGVQESQRAWCCETESEPALCGISRIWVPMATRRRGIATRMLDCVRKNFMFGTVLSPNDIAFSDPTADGKTFATKYSGTPRFLVYKYH